jgi:hypothetical protein
LKAKELKAKMSEAVKSMLAKPIHLADQVAKAAGSAQLYRPECTEIKTKAEYLASLLRQAARSDLYERPAVRITEETAQALSKALSLVAKCRDHGGILRRYFFGFVPIKLANEWYYWMVDVSVDHELHVNF